MTFIAILIALSIERFFDWSHLRYWNWFYIYRRWLCTRFNNLPSYILYASCLVPALIIIGLIELALRGWFYGSLKLLFQIVVLLYCLGPANLWADTYVCLNALVYDDPEQAVSKIKKTFDVTNNFNDPQTLHKLFINKILIESYQRIFSILFWFIIAGPVGAVLYRLVVLSLAPEQKCANNKSTAMLHQAKFLQMLLDWIPTRLYTFIFALAGHFTASISYWRKYVKQGLSTNDDLVINCGVSAADIMHDNHVAEDGSAEKTVIALIDRSFVITLVLLAMLVLMTHLT